MLELLDLMNDYLDGTIECEIYDYASGDILYTGDVYGALKKFRMFRDRDGAAYEVVTYMEIDPTSGKLYIPVEPIG